MVDLMVERIFWLFKMTFIVMFWVFVWWFRWVSGNWLPRLLITIVVGVVIALINLAIGGSSRPGYR